ncbi:(2Fe-2S) ferredoxin domain-containing protein [Breznakiella homolactica]|uniref:(2Fe-2S) ferredoxin domain-containing protein n=1 Tax=Breznakiella homolactica TaxID=2798577 RepID=A0A7T7XNQ2_9SPIR|nr:(2Fe-2S) ferredoxin domain-containing protein [Breznakiella homolactica]QQO09691.1 (2Fe-2S) ferredoxin domain-containing protein [Breznakiella homolactica]
MADGVCSIQICMGSSCFSRGNGLNAELIQRMMSDGENIGKFSSAEISGTLCEGLCKDGPIVIIDGTVYRHVTPIVLQDLLKKRDEVSA